MSEVSWQDWLSRLAGFHAAVLKLSASRGGGHLTSLHRIIRTGLTCDLLALGVDSASAVESEAVQIDVSGDLGDLQDFSDEDEETEDILDDGPSLGDEPEVDPTLAAGRRMAAAAARRIVLKQRGDQFNRETLLGYPLLAARVGRRLVVGPLLYWSVEMDYRPKDQRLTLFRKETSPTLNTGLLAILTEEEAQVDFVRTELLPLLTQGEFGIDAVTDCVDTLKGIFDPLRGLRSLPEPSLASFLEVGKDVQVGSPVIACVPVLLNGPQSFAFVGTDLGQLAKSDLRGGRTVLERILGPIVDDEFDEPVVGGLPFDDTVDGALPLVFPEKSNRAQRRVAARMRRARIMTVQGPPGTGKSQTIVNIVSDLVANGKSVLVTSHTRKALEVVSNKLPKIERLAISVLDSDRKSLGRLRTELNSVLDSPGADLGDLTHRHEEALASLRDLDSELRRLSRRYSELRRLEHDEFSGHATYAELRRFDKIVPSDAPDHNEGDSISQALADYCELAVVLAPVLDQLTELYGPGGDSRSASAQARVWSDLSDLLAVVDSAHEPIDPVALGLVDRVAASELSDELSTVANWAEWLDELTSKESPFADAATLRDLPSLKELASTVGRSRLVELDAELNSSADFFMGTDLVGDELRMLSSAEREVVTESLQIVKRSSAISWWVSRTVRRAREQLESAGAGVRDRRTRESRIARIQSCLAWQARRSELLSKLDHAGMELRISFSPGHTSTELRRIAREASDRCQLLVAALDCPLGEPRSEFATKAGEEILQRVGSEPIAEVRSFVDDLTKRITQLAWLESFRVGNVLPENQLDRWSNLEQAIVGRTGPASSDEGSLRDLCAAYPAYERMLDLEGTELGALAATVGLLRSEIVATGETPAWITHADRAIEAHRLGSLLRQSLSANPDDLTEISERLNEGQRQRLRIIHELIARRRALDVARAVRSQRTRVALKKMSDLLGRKRMTTGFVGLRGQIDYDALLSVFPCWICSINDVSRLFPLSSALFDVVIIDEASQCGQTLSLPLAYRGERLLVVGDNKQLRPAAARFLREAQLAMLQQQSEVDGHHLAQFFDGKKSLLEVAEVCADTSDFLDEHFRCDPEIIRWSNTEFYGGRLRVMTHRRDGAIKPSLSVKVLVAADEDLETKTNREEAKQIIREIRRLIEEAGSERLTIGVISLFRPQADLLNRLIAEEFAGDPSLLEHHGILASTADGFQGDERDIIIYSLRYGPSSRPGSILAIQREVERLNVAFTRAKRCCVIFQSVEPSRLPDGLIRSFVSHALEVESGDSGGQSRPDHFDSDFERQVCEALRDRGLTVTTQEPSAGYLIDLAVEDDDGRLLGVECDGEWKTNVLGQLRTEDYQRQDILERAGWAIHRVSGRAWALDPVREIDLIIRRLKELPTLSDREIARGPARIIPAPEVDHLAPESEELASAEGRATDEPEVAVLRWLGRNPSELIEAVKKLWRWLLLEGTLEAPAERQLAEIGAELDAGRELGEEAGDYLKDLWFAALRQGFNPDATDGLPEVSPAHYRPVASSPALASKVGDWHSAGLSELEMTILSLVSSESPHAVQTYRLVGELQGRGHSADEVTHDLVSGLLRGSLARWVELVRERPEAWRLADAGSGHEDAPP